MVKLLLFVAVLGIIFMVMRASNRRSKPPPAAHESEAMARCAHCGVHFPRAESVSEAERDYCSEEHRRLGKRS